ncbi:MAG: hypothetical protein ACRDFR_05010, partial [Candidatus Limnocylindria bacterium]
PLSYFGPIESTRPGALGPMAPRDSSALPGSLPRRVGTKQESVVRRNAHLVEEQGARISRVVHRCQHEA